MYIKMIYRYLLQFLDYVSWDHRYIHDLLALEVAAVKNQSLNNF